MEFTHKPDWPKAQKRIEAWWAGELVDRAVVAVTAPNGRPGRKLPVPATEEERWTNADFLIARQETWVETRYFGGESFPLFFVNLGPSIGSAYLGTEPVFAPTTAWQERPIIESYDAALPFRFNPGNRWWQKTLDITRQAVERLDGISFVSLTDLGNPTDILAHLRGPQSLLIDSIERREEIERALAELLPVWWRWYDELLAITSTRCEGSCGWLAAWSPGRTYPLQCDFSCMISPNTYRWMVVPEMKEIVARLDHPLYHLDGPGAIKHLDALLELPKLRAIQWVPGDGNPSPRHWPDLIRRILSAGRGVHASVPPEDVEPMIDEFGPRGLFFSTWCDSAEEAKSLIRRAEVASARAVRRGVA